MKEQEFRNLLLKMVDNKDNPYHVLVWVNGDPIIGEGTYIGGFSEINAKGASVTIGANCDIASFVAINVADSHRRCIGLETANDCKDICIGDNVFIGSHAVILGGATIGHHCVVGAGSVIRACTIPPYSLVLGDLVRPGYYKAEYEKLHGTKGSR